MTCLFMHPFPGQAQGLSKAKDLVISDSYLDLMTTSSAELVRLQRRKQILDQREKELDQKGPLPPHPEEDEISAQEGMPLYWGVAYGI